MLLAITVMPAGSNCSPTIYSVLVGCFFTAMELVHEVGPSPIGLVENFSSTVTLNVVLNCSYEPLLAMIFAVTVIVCSPAVDSVFGEQVHRLSPSVLTPVPPFAYCTFPQMTMPVESNESPTMYVIFFGYVLTKIDVYHTDGSAPTAGTKASSINAAISTPNTAFLIFLPCFIELSSDPNSLLPFVCPHAFAHTSYIIVKSNMPFVKVLFRNTKKRRAVAFRLSIKDSDHFRRKKTKKTCMSKRPFRGRFLYPFVIRRKLAGFSPER